MSITVQSNEPKAETAKPSANEGGKVDAQAQTEQNTSAPEAKTSEHNSSEESGTPETEAAASETQTESQTETDAEKEKPAEESEAEPESESDTQPEKAAKKKGGFQRRIDKLTQEREFWREQALRNAQASGQSPAQPKVETPKPAAVEGKPDPSKYGTHEEYLDARDEWNRKQWRAEQERDRIAAEQAKSQTTYAERVQDFVKTHPDFDEVMATTESVTSPVIEQVITTSEIGPAIRYELAKDPKEAFRIAKLPPILAAKELGKLEDKLAAKKAPEAKPETKKVSSAPKPLTPVNGGGKAAATPKSLDELAKTDFAGFKRQREEELKLKRRRA